MLLCCSSSSKLSCSHSGFTFPSLMPLISNGPHFFCFCHPSSSQPLPYCSLSLLLSSSSKTSFPLFFLLTVHWSHTQHKSYIFGQPDTHIQIIRMSPIYGSLWCFMQRFRWKVLHLISPWWSLRSCFYWLIVLIHLATIPQPALPSSTSVNDFLHFRGCLSH